MCPLNLPTTDGWPYTRGEDSCTGTLTNGGLQSFSLDTGTSVSIGGSSGSGSVPIIISDLGRTPSKGPDNSLDGAAYYDFKIQTITDGTAQVCISSPSSMLMDYWDGNAWVPARNVEVSTCTFHSGYICGLFEVSSLGGTPVSVGTSTH